MIFQGKTVEDAIAAGLRQLGISRDDAEITVLEQGDRVTVRRSARRLKLIDISGDGYFRAVNRKLMQPVKQTGE